MLHLLCFFLIFNIQYSFYGASPLIGKGVRMANLEEFPFIVSLSRKTNGSLEREELSHFCGGSLITTTHVLTAAYCLSQDQLKNIVVKIGSIDLRKARAYEIKWSLTYSQWSGIRLIEADANTIYDMAIIKLRGAVSDIELPTISYTLDKDLYDKSALTAGWGLIEDDKQPRYMRIAKFIIKTPENCESLRKLNAFSIKDLIAKLYLCTAALSDDASITCGDAGSPLLRGDNNIVGVNTAYCTPVNTVPLSGYKSFHSSVNAYAEFIEAVKRK